MSLSLTMFSSTLERKSSVLNDRDFDRRRPNSRLTNQSGSGGGTFPPAADSDGFKVIARNVLLPKRTSKSLLSPTTGSGPTALLRGVAVISTLTRWAYLETARYPAIRPAKLRPVSTKSSTA